MKLLIALMMMLTPVLTQDNSSSLIFDDGPIAFTSDPMPGGDYTDQNILPLAFPEAMPPAAQDLCNAYDVWTAEAYGWLGMNVDLPKNISMNMTIV
jgi:hypothetical protein